MAEVEVEVGGGGGGGGGVGVGGEGRGRDKAALETLSGRPTKAGLFTVTYLQPL